jgi:hypothetical protein
MNKRIPHGHRKNVYQRVIQDKKKVQDKKRARVAIKHNSKRVLDSDE